MITPSRIRQLLQLSFILLLPLALGGASSCKSKKMEVTILHTNDLHSYLKAAAPGAPENPYGLGGFARLKTLVDQIRQSKPNTVLVDAGDFSEGSMYYSVDGGASSLRIMDAIGYQATVVGNHDFLNGPGELGDMIERAKTSFPVLGANKNLSALPYAEAERLARLVPEYKVIEVGSGADKLRVALIGLMTDDFLYYEYFKPAVVTNAVEKASALARKIHDENIADMIVVLSHNGFSKQPAWAKMIPWITAIISGHSHEKTPQPLTILNAGQPVYVMEAGEHGQFLGELTLIIDKVNRTARLKSYTLHPVHPGIAEDPVIAAMVAGQDRGLEQKFGDGFHDKPVAEAVDAFPRSSGESAIGNLLTDAYRLAADTQIGLESSSLIGDGLSAGPVSAADIYSVVPHIYGPVAGMTFPQAGQTWTLKRMSFRGAQLRGLLNALLFASNFDFSPGWISISGLKIVYSRNGGASPIQTIQVLNGTTGRYEPLNDQAIYTAALHDGLLLAVEVLVKKLGLAIDLSQAQETGIEAWRALHQFASQRFVLNPSDYGVGQRYRLVEADLVLVPHQIRFTEAGLAVVIPNQGLAPSGASLTLKVTRSAANDAVHDGLPDQPMSPIANAVAIPPIGPGETAEITLPWPATAPGTYAVKFLIEGGDGNLLNNTLTWHLMVD